MRSPLPRNQVLADAAQLAKEHAHCMHRTASRLDPGTSPHRLAVVHAHRCERLHEQLHAAHLTERVLMSGATASLWVLRFTRNALALGAVRTLPQLFAISREGGLPAPTSSAWKSLRH